MNDKLGVDVLLGNGGLEVLGLEKPQEELVNQLEVWPTGLQGRLVLLGVKFRPRGVRGGREGPERILAELRETHDDDTALKVETDHTLNYIC